MRAVILLSIACVGALFAREPLDPVTKPSPAEAPPSVWLGVRVAKPDPAMTAHLPDLPAGIGFIVTGLDAGGPCEQAGVAAFDILWKMDEQLLVNEAQLAALLRLASPGDRIHLSGFRKGQPVDFEVRLAEAPMRDTAVGALLNDSLLAGPLANSPRVVRFAEKVATYATDDGKISVTRKESGYHVRIDSSDGQIIYQGEMAENGTVEGLDEHWVRRVHALRRGLDHRESTGPSMPYAVRPRIAGPVVSDSHDEDR